MTFFTSRHLACLAVPDLLAVSSPPKGGDFGFFSCSRAVYARLRQALMPPMGRKQT